MLSVLRALVVVCALAPITACTADTASGEEVVYVTKTGEKYHRKRCGYLRHSSIAKPLSEAVDDGYEPCSACRPPRLKENK